MTTTSRRFLANGLTVLGLGLAASGLLGAAPTSAEYGTTPPGVECETTTTVRRTTTTVVVTTTTVVVTTTTAKPTTTTAPATTTTVPVTTSTVPLTTSTLVEPTTTGAATSTVAPSTTEIASEGPTTTISRVLPSTGSDTTARTAVGLAVTAVGVSMRLVARRQPA